MKTRWLPCLLMVVLCLPVAASSGTTDDTRLPYRWFFVFGFNRARDDVEQIKILIDTAAEQNLNGMVLSLGLDSITRWSEEDVALLREIADHCAARRIELIPTGFSAGYGGGALGHDRSFAAALPTVITLKAAGGQLVPVSGPNVLINGDLEDHTDHRFTAYAFHDRPGEVSFADARAANGHTSIRFENFGRFEHGHGRLMQTVDVTPGRTYRLAFQLQTESLAPVSGLKAMIYSEGRSLAEIHPQVEPTQDWTRFSLDYINQNETTVNIYIGMWGGQRGRFRIDDITFRETTDLSDIVRREGTPLELKSRDRDRRFEEGKDYQPIRCLRQLNSIALTQSTAIRDNESLELSCYKIPSVHHEWGRQISLCMSNPQLYEYWQAQAKRLHEILGFNKFLLAMDEIRNGGGCLSCKNRNLTMAEILGDCVTRQHAMLKKLDPTMEVLIWSDMLDPNHNAHNNYYGIVGDFTNSWKYVPRDLTILCWSHSIRNESLSFFSAEDFAVMGAAYYDANDLTGCKEWLASLHSTPNARGIMYTTWERKYDLLADFARLVSLDRAD